MPLIPVINKDPAELVAPLQEKLYNPDTQRRMVLVIVCIALLLDNMLYMVIVPIIPVFLRDINHPELADGANQWYFYYGNTTFATPPENAVIADYSNLAATKNYTVIRRKLHPLIAYDGSEDTSIGFLFASKAIVQLLVNPFSGTIIDRYGYDFPMIIGLTIIFLSTTIFAFGNSYGVLFVARSLQGVGSAFADTSGLAMIADRFTEDEARSKALGIALAFISFGCLFAPPFGGILYEFAGKCVPFIFLALIALVDGLLLFLVMKPIRKERSLTSEMRPKGTPIHHLIMDPMILCCAGALVMANVSLAFLEPTIAIWMKDTMQASEWEIGLVWLPAFFPHVFGVYLTVKLAKAYPSQQWLITAVGLCLEGVSCLIIPFCTTFGSVIIPIMINCFGIALVDTAILPTLGYIVDLRHVSVYGSIYAIADISYSLAYAFGPIVAGGVVASIGFTWLNIGIFVSNILYAPVLFALRNIYKYKPFENESNVLMDDPPQQQYKTYMMSSQEGTTLKEVDMDTKNHLELEPRSVANHQTQDYKNAYNQDVPAFQQLPAVPRRPQQPPNRPPQQAGQPQQQQQPQPEQQNYNPNNPFINANMMNGHVENTGNYYQQ